MSTNRVRKHRKSVEIDPEMMQMHIEIGDCLLAGYGKGCACGLTQYDGTPHPALVAELLRLGLPLPLPEPLPVEQ